MNEQRFICGTGFTNADVNFYNPIRIIHDNENDKDYYLFADLCKIMNEQQSLIGQLQDENLYKNFKLKSVDDLKKLKDIFEICMILIDGAIADEDLELGYESVFQFERRIQKFNGDD